MIVALHTFSITVHIRWAQLIVDLNLDKIFYLKFSKIFICIEEEKIYWLF
jgi:hypothetical protein